MLWKNARKAKTHVSGFKGGKTWYGSGVKGWERRNHATKGAKNMAGDKRLCLVSWINVFYLTYVKVFIILYIVRGFSKLVLLFKKKNWVDENSLDHGCCPLKCNSAPLNYFKLCPPFLITSERWVSLSLEFYNRAVYSRQYFKPPTVATSQFLSSGSDSVH